MKDYLSVKEFSKLSGIEQTTLRYWDDIGLFSPARRDPDNNYRYYSPQQIISVNFITVLSDLNIPLKTIGELERERTPAKIVELIETQEMILDMEMRRLREAYSVIHARRQMINFGMTLAEGFYEVDGRKAEGQPESGKGTWVDESSIAVLVREDRNYITGPLNEWPEDGSFYEPFVNFCGAAEDMRLNLNYPIGAIHNSYEEFLKAPGQPNHFISLDPTGNKIRKKGKYMVGFSRGYYGIFSDIAERMDAYAKKHKIKTSGPVYAMYLLDEICMRDQEDYLVQVSVAVS